MRILFLNELSDPRIGSSVRQMYQAAAALRARGHETALVTCTEDASQATPTTIEGLTTFRLHSSYNVRYRSFVSLDNAQIRTPFREILETWRPDVVHSHLLHTHLSYASLTAARAFGAGVVFTAHDVMTFCYQKLTCFHGGEEHGGELRDYAAYWQKCIPCQRLRYNPWRNAAIRRVLSRDVDRLTVVSDELGHVLRANRIRVDRTIHNAIELRSKLPDAAAVATLRRKFGLEGKRVIAIGGRLHEQKGVTQLLRMLALLAPEFPDLVLLVMGKRDVYDREFEPIARQLGVADRVVATGWLDGDELQAAYSATDVFVTPSICFDTFGLVNLEAMEHGKPVVATVFGGSPEVVEQGRTGFLENPFDVSSFSDRVRVLLLDASLRERMGAAGHRRLLERFTIDRLASEWMEEYEHARALR
jgi:glycosyltransferase involved in cell wall biosynthesis